MTDPQSTRYADLARDTRVRGEAYRSQDIYERELEMIWHKVWVYVGHESETPNPGDYVRRQIGAQPVIMVRGRDDKVRVFFNRCRHRANLVCHLEHGKTKVFTCPYHGWSYANTGELLGATFAEGYDEGLNKAELGLTPVPRLGVYRGLVFASLSPDGISLEAHLGQVTEFIDLFIDLSPVGEADLNTGVQKMKYRGNWKYMPENSMEGDYHGPFIHRVAFQLHAKRTGFDVSSLHQNAVPDVIRSLPGGHMVEDYRGATMAPPARPPSPARLEYIAAMKARHGEEKAKALLSTMAPLVYVFPNLIYIMTHLRRIQPVSVDETYVYYTPMFLKGAPDEINENRLRDHEFMMGPAGFITPDDVEIMERNQVAMQAQGDDWLFIGRGKHRERETLGGGTSGFTMDENHLRGFWRHYTALMSGEAA